MASIGELHPQGRSPAHLVPKVMTSQNQNQPQNQHRTRRGDQPQNQPQNQPDSADVLASMAGGPAKLPQEAAADTRKARLAAMRSEVAARSKATGKATGTGRKPLPAPIAWPEAIKAQTKGMVPAFFLPSRPPARGLATEGICRGRRCFAAAPADLTMLNQPVPPAPTDLSGHEMQNLLLCLVHNDYYGTGAVHDGLSAVDGGELPLGAVLDAFEMAQTYGSRKWAQILFPVGDELEKKSKQTCLLHKFAEMAGRYVVFDCETFNIKLLTDFYTA
jgi:hypothetical protein